MRDVHYKSKSFRLSDRVLEELKNRKQGFGSYNLLISDLLFGGADVEAGKLGKTKNRIR